MQRSRSRHAMPEMTPPRGVERIDAVRSMLEATVLDAFAARVQQQPFADEDERKERLHSVRSRLVDLLDSWHKVVSDLHDVGVDVQYQRYELPQVRPLLREILERDFASEDERKFRANRSLRDVEPEVNLFLKELTGKDVGGDA